MLLISLVTLLLSALEVGSSWAEGPSWGGARGSIIDGFEGKRVSWDPASGPLCGLDETVSQQTSSGISELMQFRQYLSTGTTIVGVCCSEGIVLGADTRATGGPVVMDKNKLKIHRIAPNIACCAAGTSADCEQIARNAAHFVALQSIAGSYSGLDVTTFSTVSAAVNCVVNAMKGNGASKRKPSAVFILGGSDQTGPHLYQIDSDGFPQRISYGAKGSGSSDAIAVLESGIFLHNRQNSSGHTDDPHCLPMNITDAVDLVRRAVQAGILNDLGSGSHVDLCVIPFQSDRRQQRLPMRLWREWMVTNNKRNKEDVVDKDDDGGDEGRMKRSPEETEDDLLMGEKVWSSHLEPLDLLSNENGRFPANKVGFSFIHTF